MNLKIVAALIGATVLMNAHAADSTTQAAGLEKFQKRVDKIAAENGVKAPDVKKELTAQGVSASKTQQKSGTLPGVSPIERIVAIDAEVIRAIKSRDGKLMYLIDNGRFAFVGKMIDVWQRKELNTIEEIAQAVSRIDLVHMGFKLESVNHISVGKGTKHVTVFIDPQCGWCHKLMAELNANPDLLEKYVFDFVIVPVLGPRSEMLAKKLYCAKTQDDAQKYAALVGGATNIERLEAQSDCDLKNFEDTRVTANAVGVKGVPMIIAHDGRFERGKPNSLRDFLEPKQPEVNSDSKAESAKP